jgi:hypothetical protein
VRPTAAGANVPVPVNRPASVVRPLPPLTIRLDRRHPNPRLLRRSFATSRFGFDHSWVGALAFTTLLALGSLAPARATNPVDNATGVAAIDVHEVA